MMPAVGDNTLLRPTSGVRPMSGVHPPSSAGSTLRKSRRGTTPSPSRPESASPWVYNIHDEMPVDMDRMRELVAKQQAVYDGIVSNMRAFEEQYEVDRQINTSMHELGDEGDSGLAKDRSAFALASKMHSKKKRAKTFQQRRNDELANQELARMRFILAQQEQEDRAAKRLQEMLASQKRRAFYVQARKNEQMKIRHDMARDEKNAWSRFYDKEHAKRQQESLLDRPSTQQRSLKKSLSAPIPLKLEDEPVYRRALDSHKLYADTLVKWNNLVEENSRRSDLFWRRTTGFAPSRPRRRTPALLRHQGGASPSPTSPNSSGDEAGKTRMNTDSPTPRRRPSWHSRKQKVDEYHDCLEELGNRKAKRTEEKLEEAGKRRDGEVQQKKQSAETYMENWSERQRQVVQRKHKILEDGFADMGAKERQFAERYAENRENELMELERRKEANEMRMRRALTQAGEIEAKTEERRRSKLHEKVSKSEEILAGIQEDLVKKSENAGTASCGTGSISIREKVSEDFRRKAEREMKDKDARKEKLLHQRSMGMLDRLREDRGKNGKVTRNSIMNVTITSSVDAGSTPGTPTQSSTLKRALTPVPLTSVEDSWEMSPPGSTMTHTLSNMLQTPSAIERTPSHAPSPTNSRTPHSMVRSPSILAGPLDIEGPGNATLPEVAAAMGSRPSSRSSDDGFDDSFLEDLEKRSSRWLHEMRRKQDI